MNYIKDTLALSGRLIKHNLRSLDTIITVVAMPVMILLAMVYLFGGAIQIDGLQHDEYVQYVLPGILLITIATGSAYTALRINLDKTGGMFDRFRSMPISKSAVLSGHVLASIVFMLTSTTIVLVVGFLIGFRTSASPLEWLYIILLVVGFAIMVTWLSVPFALAASSVDGASAFSYLVLALLFVSSAFAPTNKMPAALEAFAKHQPMTNIIATIRNLFASNSVGADGWLSIVWLIGITLVSWWVGVKIYNRV
ncbi:ABC transporter permease [Paucilactobacillus wasatchensis]|uniref:Transport permease protein n=1 Tax=Paucilactobacillus wasatchensis TaxID=1335616 RepID=A0A0D1A987_9LACO|nr:ABC transporter permease [Paucilactobacillus wasatchensis]KIS04272.1 ABC transporter, permease protein [Paucilactobacillus wasatchensis]